MLKFLNAKARGHRNPDSEKKCFIHKKINIFAKKRATKNMKYLETLNPPQLEAVTSPPGPMMLIAGAGSGKTRVLTFRIAYLMEKENIEPFRILALTFTNKAAKEMRNRIEKLVGEEARNLWMGTFHSVFAKMLRFEAQYLGFTPNFTIYDTTDSVSLVKTVIKELGLEETMYKPKSIFHRISSAKNNLVSWQNYTQNAVFFQQDKEAMRPETGRIYKAYVERCFKANSMDFDDLLFNTNVLFKNFPEILQKYQNKFQYIFVDEFQDTNLSQYLITKRLSEKYRNICVVGDDAQSIYAFRGANIKNILDFEKDYPDLKVIKLEQNYRSTKNIVQAANQVIACNTMQLKKQVWTQNEGGALIRLLKATSDNEEGRLVTNIIFEEKMHNGLSNRDFAILYRTNSQSRAFEESLRKLNIRYKIVGGLSFYDRKEIKDILAYLRYCVNPADEEAFKRIINYPKRGIGDTTLNKIIISAFEKNIPLWDVICETEKYLGKGRLLATVASFAEMIRAFIAIVNTKDAFEAASHIAKNSGILQELYDDKTLEGRGRYENLQELLNAIKEFTDRQNSDDRSISAFLQEISLLSAVDQDKDEGDSVTLMTIHASKGLEFKHVFVVGMEEDLFPSQMMIGSREELEEERRLFYVAITRAEKKLTLSYALQRYRFGNLRPCEPSRFLDEIDPAFLQVDKFMGRANTPSNTQNVDNQMATNNFSSMIKRSNPTPQNHYTVVKSTNTSPNPTNFTPSDPKKLAEGMKVLHQKFGLGTILKMEQTGNDRRAKIKFEAEGEKTLLVNFAKLMIQE